MFHLRPSRAVRGALGDGDAYRPKRARLRGICGPVCSLFLLRCADSLHPPGHGGPVCLPACLASALVRDWEMVGGKDRMSEREACVTGGLEKIYYVQYCLLIFLCFSPRVEFQNKFYSGTGYKLNPFAFSSLIHASSAV